MVRLIDVPVGEDLLRRMGADAAAHEPERLAVVFPSQRAVHHFGVELARRAGHALRPPALYPLERFVAELAGLAEEDLLPETDAVHLLWRVVRDETPHVLVEESRDFATFYPWGSAFVKALDELDRELAEEALLRRVPSLEAFDTLGPEAQRFYEALPALRKGYHRELKKDGRCTKGTVYRAALARLERGEAGVPGAIFFGGFFALTRGDLAVVKALGRASGVTLYRHHDGREWEAFKTLERELAAGYEPEEVPVPRIDLHLHAAPSVHGEVLAAGRLLRGEGMDLGRTAVVLPDPEPLVPLLWEAVGGLGVDYNITMGYPLVRTPIYALLDQALRVVETTREGRVRVLEYLRLLFHPYAKGFGGADSGTRLIVHAVEEVLRRRGTAYLRLDDLERDAEILKRASLMTRSTGQEIPSAECGARLRELNDLLVRGPAGAADLGGLARALERVVLVVGQRSDARHHAFFEDFFAKAADCLHALAELGAAREPSGEDGALFPLVRKHLAEASVPFAGLPVQGLQIMGLLETRALAFDAVIVLDANADLLPPVSRHDALLPPPVRALLGLPGYRERAEVSKYHLFRLLQSCGTAHVVYRDTPDAPRSFFVEELLFQVERRRGRAGVAPPARYAFPFHPEAAREPEVPKDEALLARLASLTYSASALDQYLQCPMRFYFGTVLGVRELEQAGEEMDVRRVGSALHDALLDLYAPHVGEALAPEAYDEMLGRLPALLEAHFGTQGEQVLLRTVARQRLERYLGQERGRATARGVRLLGVEERMETALTFEGRPFAFKGKLDRVEDWGGTTVIIDTKSGKGLDRKVPRADAAPPFTDRVERYKALRSLQLPVYVELVRACRGTDYATIQAQLVSLRDLAEAPAVLFGEGVSRAERMAAVFLPAIGMLLREITDPARPFVPEPADEKLCASCPFRALCRRTG